MTGSSLTSSFPCLIPREPFSPLRSAVERLEREVAPPLPPDGFVLKRGLSGTGYRGGGESGVCVMVAMFRLQDSLVPMSKAIGCRYK